MNRATPRHLLHYVTRRLRLRRYLKDPGDGRQQPQIPAQALLWALLIGQILRQSSFHAVEALARSSARRTLSIATPFCDDTLGYFTERLDPGPTRQALLSLIRGAKRNKAFDDCRWIGLAIDGTGAGWRSSVFLAGLQPRFFSMERIVWSSGTRRISIPGKRSRVFLSPAQAGRQGGGSLLADEFPLLHRGPAGSVPHGQEPLGDRKPRLQRRQESSRPRAYLSSSCQQSADRMAPHHAGLDHRTTLQTTGISIVVNTGCTVAPSCCCSCGSVSPDRVLSTAADAQQKKNEMSSFSARGHSPSQQLNNAANYS
jgi:hypothetical protein